MRTYAYSSGQYFPILNAALDTPMCLSVDLDSCIFVCMAELSLNDSHKHKHRKRGGAGGNEGAQEETRGRRRKRLLTFTAYLK